MFVCLGTLATHIHMHICARTHIQPTKLLKFFGYCNTLPKNMFYSMSQSAFCDMKATNRPT